MRDIQADYSAGDKKKIKAAEIKSKAAATFLGKTTVASIKKLETNMSNMRKALAKQVLNLSRQGKALGQQQQLCAQLIAVCEKVRAAGAAGNSDLAEIAGLVGQDKQLKAVDKNTGALIQAATTLMADSKAEVIRNRNAYAGLQELDEKLGDWEGIVEGWKANRPDSVRHIGNCFKAMQVIFQVGAAAASMGASTASFVPPDVQFSMVKPDSITDLALNIADNAKSLNDATGAARKAYEKVKS